MKKQKYNMKNLLGNNFCKSVALLAIVLLTALPAVSVAQTITYTGVIVDGKVFGGGRMADVNGKSVIHVIGQEDETDTLGGVYGGNDIAGSVLGTDGSTIIIGSNEATLTAGNENDIRIGEVYGGGNGYYTYPEKNIKTGLGETETTFVAGTIKTFKGDADVQTTTGGNVPSIVKTSITVNGYNVKIDSLFGGAKNAFINGSSTAAADDIDININNGTIYAAFGGNNYGGAINSGSGIEIDIANTKLNDPLSWAKIGKDHGIAYLYGGGNKVVAPKVVINITGGMIDTCFTGGNSATVNTSATTTVNVASNVIYTTASDPTTHALLYDGNGVYNVHTLFGGNNAAAMGILPTLNLTSGGIGTVYGGGNAGDMKAGNTDNHSGYTIGTDVNITSADIKIDLVYGGCQKANVDNSTYVSMSDGSVGTIYGGCNISGTIGGTNVLTKGANVFISGGTVHKNVFGGSNGYYGCRDEVTYKYSDDRFNPKASTVSYIGTLFPLVNNTQVNITGGTFEGNIYGGGNLAPVGVDRAITDVTFASDNINKGKVTLSISDGTTGTGVVLIKGNVFGGGRMASVFGEASVTMNAYDAYAENGEHVITNGVNVKGDIYGGNDIAGTIQSTHDYAASNSQTYEVAASVFLDGKLKLDGSVYGGGNGNYTYYDNATQFTSATEANKVLVCDETNRPVVGGGAIVDVNTDAAGHVHMVYGGGNSATVGIQAIVLLNNTARTEDVANVDTIFGGNNSVDMAIMPTLTLTKGNVNTVYGGGNKGGITCTNGTAHSPSAAAGVNLTGLSTYVLLNSSDVNINSIYGGCRIADVAATTYVDLYAGTSHEIYGGNDVAGNVTSSVVNLNGAATNGITVDNIYGGGNGYYDYSGSNVYQFGYKDDANRANHLVATLASTASAPNVGETHVNLTKGTVTGYVYGGGKAGDATTTYVTVEAGAKVQGTIFGGGCGDYAHIGYCSDDFPHVGNTGTANVVINGMYADIPRIFAGGRAGDVENTYITVNDAVAVIPDPDPAPEQPKIGALYGGCMASNLTGTTHVTIGNTVSTPSASDKYVITIDTIYGGNDFAGLTQNTEIEINNGKFVHLYGAGNGDYDYKSIMRGKTGVTLGTTCLDTIPYSMNVDVTINGGYFDNKVYGGGNMGLVGSKDITYLDKDHDGDPDYPEGTQNADLYGYIYMTVHGGYFNNHIFAGAAGKLNYKKQYFGFDDANNIRYPGEGHDPIPGFTSTDRVSLLVYGYKQFNMDGGEVRFSVYGGSESVDDGYPYECWDSDPAKTSRRPSSVINIMGGTVQNRIYGAGYKGNVFGSVYVNVGQMAILNSPVWTKTYQRSGTAKGTGVTFADQLSNHTEIYHGNPIYLLNSIYNGSDWGEAGANQYFTTRGFYGGEGLINIDGEGYTTSTTVTSSDPVMELTASLLGSGTSTAPADVNSRITVKNYGDYYNCPAPSRALKSIQRTNRVFLENVYIDLEGDNDAYSSYTSVRYSMNRIDTLIFHRQNLIETVAPSINIGRMVSEDLNGNPYTYADLQGGIKGDAENDCSNSSICDLVDATVQGKNVLLLDNASYISVSQERLMPTTAHPEGETVTVYGPVIGYAYLLASNNTRAYVYADLAPSTITDAEEKKIYSGFVGPCYNANHSATDQQIEFIVSSTNEYRSWGVGTEGGERKRQLTLVAHINPDKVIEDHKFTGPNLPNAGTPTIAESGKWAYVDGSITLPPTSNGHFYTISSVIIDEDNGGQLMLTEHAYDPANPLSSTNGWYTPYANPSSNLGQSQTKIATSSANTFGLMFSLGDDFFDLEYDDPEDPTETPRITRPEGYRGSPAVGEDPATPPVSWKDKTVISGTANLATTAESFLSKPISGGADGVLPTINFALTYYTAFATTFTRDVVIVMDEYDASGNEVGPVEVTVTISTVISDFDNLEAPVLAMYNTGRKNTYTRRVTIPASFVQRDLYLTGIEWAPINAVDNYPTSTNSSIGRFQLESTEADLTSSTYDYKHFSIGVNPTQRVSGNATSTLGWYDIDPNAQNMDAYVLGNSPATHWTSGGLVDLTNDGANQGKHIGILDGRSVAAFDITLNFDGNLIYEREPDLASLKLHFKYYDTKTNTSGEHDDFYIDVQVRTRQSGDTIYMAEPDQFYLYDDGTNITISQTVLEGQTPVSIIHRYGQRGDIPVPQGDSFINYSKNDPLYYLSTFESALAIYDEGDVICILDAIHVNDATKPISIQGQEINEINIIRYSGSHYRWPGEVCSYRGPMIVVSDGAKFIASYVYFDGSGCALTADGVDGQSVRSLQDTRYNTGSPTSEHYLIMESTKYSYYKTKRDTLFANAPIFWVEDGSTLKLNAGVTLTNNYNYDNNSIANVTHYSGGAIGMLATTAGAPTVQLGTDIKIEGNLIVNHSTTDCGAPLNYGGAIYNNGGKVELGVSGSDHIINVNDNYYIPKSVVYPGTDFRQYFAEGLDEIPIPPSGTYNRYYYKRVATNNGYHNSNIYLTRTKPASVASGHEYEKVTTDAQSDMIYVKDELSANSKIGVSKWFPGFKARDIYGRDTIAFANYTAAGVIAARNNFESNIFKDDSATYRGNYCITDASNDEVDVRWSSILNTSNIYFHRCATFDMAAKPIAYHKNPDVFCPGDGDTITFKIQGGSSLYTYNLYQYPSSTRESGAATKIASITDPADSGNFVPLSLNLPAGSPSATYYLQAEAIEAGGCFVQYPIEMRVVQVAPEPKKVKNSVNSEWLGKTTSTEYDVPSATAVNNYRTVGEGENQVQVPNDGRIFRIYSYITVDWSVKPDPSYGEIAATLNGELSTAISSANFCPGDVIKLQATPKDRYEFVMWDNDPFTTDSLTYVVRNQNASLHAYMAPNTYWYQTQRVNPGTGHYEVDYRGNVTIKDETGLAWLISTVNGLNNQQAESFIWDTITIKAHDYDMSAHKWTPVGNLRNPFRGVINMEDGASINGITINEKMLSDVGFFGVTDSARINNMNIGSATIHGTTYGGALIGLAGANTKVETATIAGAKISSANAVGGLAGRVQNASFNNITIANTVELIGSTLYGGGVAGDVSSGKLENSNSINPKPASLEPLYYGSFFGKADGESTVPGPTDPSAKSAGRTRIENSYANVSDCPRAYYAGGLVGYATETDLQNNYVYGNVSGISAVGGLVGMVGDNVNIDRCYYAQDMPAGAFGKGDANASHVATFNGSGNQVTINDTIEGTNNLTRLLNNWVRENGDSYNTWRSDFDTLNSGYPLFGTPDMIPVYGDTVSAVVCDTFAFSPDYKFTESGVYNIVFSDSVLFIDSIITIDIIVNHSVNTEYSDTVEWGSDYSGYDFNLSSAEIAMYRDGQNVRYPHYYTTAEGCDSTINLNLFILNGPVGIDGKPVQFNISIYPNPTSGVVNIEADGLMQVELYDATSRKVLSQRVDSQESAAALQLNLSQIAAGSYYIRIHTNHGDAVQKIIKR